MCGSSGIQQQPRIAPVCSKGISCSGVVAYPVVASRVEDNFRNHVFRVVVYFCAAKSLGLQIERYCVDLQCLI